MSENIPVRFGWTTEAPRELHGALAINPTYQSAELRFAEALSAFDLLLNELTPDEQQRVGAAAAEMANASSELVAVMSAVRMQQVVGSLRNEMAERESQWREWGAAIEQSRSEPPPVYVDAHFHLPESLSVQMTQAPRSFAIEKSSGETVTVVER